MRPSRRVPTHPGEILLEEFLQPMGLSRSRLADHLGLPASRISEVVRGRRSITPDTAWMLAQALGTTPEFWMELQLAHDVVSHRPTRRITRLRKVS